jgi:hypothetical protein
MSELGHLFFSQLSFCGVRACQFIKLSYYFKDDLLLFFSFDVDDLLLCYCYPFQKEKKNDLCFQRSAWMAKLESTMGKILNQLEIKPEMPVFYGICVLLPILCMEIESKTHVISVPSS